MLGHRELGIDDYLAMLRRRWWVILIPMVLGPLIAYGIALRLPSRYTSQTLVLVEQQKVPDSFVKPVITEDLNLRLGTMQEQILSRTRLQPMIERFGLYKDETGKAAMEDLVDQMRQAISVLPVKSVVSTKEGDLPGFYISFTANNPTLAQQVCQEITSMFIEVNLRQREQTAQGTTNFLETQLQDAKRKLDEEDAKLAQFKRKYLGALPDSTQTNLNVLTTLNTQLEAVTQALNRAQQDKVYTESILAQQVAAWEALKTGNTTPQPETLEQQIGALQDRLAALQARYTSNHPDVIKVKTIIEDLKKKARDAAAAPKPPPTEKTTSASVAEPPQVQQLRGQLRASDEAIRGYVHEQERLKGQISLYQSRVQLSPLVEQEFKELTRDYQTASDFYNELLKKRNQSEMATDLERRQQGEQFRVLDPPNLPEKPSFPDRPVFALAGLGGGLALGLGLAFLLEFRDKSLRTERDIEFYLGLPTLVMVPSIRNAGNGRRFWRRRQKKATLQAGHPVEV